MIVMRKLFLDRVIKYDKFSNISFKTYNQIYIQENELFLFLCSGNETKYDLELRHSTRNFWKEELTELILLYGEYTLKLLSKYSTQSKIFKYDFVSRNYQILFLLFKFYIMLPITLLLKRYSCLPKLNIFVI